MNKIRKGDTVIVISGRDSSPAKRGVVKQVYDDGKLLVEGVNLVKKHQKPNPMKNQTGGIITKEMPIQASNVAIFNPATGKPDRVGFKLEQINDGGRTKTRKVRIFKSNGNAVGT
jgi:large subunit ribosomal protein L24